MSRFNPGLDGGHILVDLDGTLAMHVSGNHAAGLIGEPIQAMVAIVKEWLFEGRDVRVFTARAYPDNSISGNEIVVKMAAVREWCQVHLGRPLTVTCMKSPDCDAIYDDRAYHVEHNTGLIVAPHPD
jgi:hypothetical protein